MSDPFVGQILIVGFNFAPVGWALCNGQLLSISMNTALFSLLGTTYGGDGKSNFALPDLRGRVPLNHGQGSGLQIYDLGQVEGTETHSLLMAELPAHNHLVNASNSSANKGGPGSKLLAASQTVTPTADPLIYYQGTPNRTMAATMITNAGGNAGGTDPHNNMQPYLALTFIIALQGVFPPRP